MLKFYCTWVSFPLLFSPSFYRFQRAKAVVTIGENVPCAHGSIPFPAWNKEAYPLWLVGG